MLIEQKLSNLEHYVTELSALIKADIFEILRDDTLLHAVERLFQLTVDTMVDINTHFIAENNFEAPDDYQSTFITMGQHDILSMDFAVRIAPIVGLRNRVVHQYESLDMKQFISRLKDELSDVRQFMRAIVKHLPNQIQP